MLNIGLVAWELLYMRSLFTGVPGCSVWAIPPLALVRPSMTSSLASISWIRSTFNSASCWVVARPLYKTVRVPPPVLMSLVWNESLLDLWWDKLMFLALALLARRSASRFGLIFCGRENASLPNSTESSLFMFILGNPKMFGAFFMTEFTRLDPLFNSA